MEEELNMEIQPITEDLQLQKDAERKEIAVGQDLLDRIAESGKNMLAAAIAQSVLVVLLYIVGYIISSFSNELTEWLYDKDIELSETTLPLMGLMLLLVAMVLIPSLIFMFLYATSAQKAAKGNQRAFHRAIRHLKSFFIISAIVIMVAVFASIIIVLAGLL